MTETDKTLLWKAGAAIDADGAYRAYHPDSKSGLDNLKNAGGPPPDKWYGVVTDSNGKPIIQGPNDSAPGFLISPTSLQDKGYKVTDPRRYVDAESVPYIAVPKDAIKLHNVKMGDICVVYNKLTDLHCFGVVADAGPGGKWSGELSIAMGKSVGIKNCSPRNGGQNDGITYLVFKNSSLGWPRAPAEINDQAEVLLADFGGIEKLK